MKHLKHFLICLAFSTLLQLTLISSVVNMFISGTSLMASLVLFSVLFTMILQPWIFILVRFQIQHDYVITWLVTAIIYYLIWFWTTKQEESSKIRWQVSLKTCAQLLTMVLVIFNLLAVCRYYDIPPADATKAMQGLLKNDKLFYKKACFQRSGFMDYESRFRFKADEAIKDFLINEYKLVAVDKERMHPIKPPPLWWRIPKNAEGEYFEGQEGNGLFRMIYFPETKEIFFRIFDT